MLKFWIYACSQSPYSLDGYKHVVKEAYCPAIFSDTRTFLQETTGRQSVTKVIPRSMEAALNQDSLEGTILQKPVYHLKLVQISGSTLGLIIADVVCASVYWLIIAIYSSGNA